MPNAGRYVRILLAVGGERISICGKITLSDDFIFHFLVRERTCVTALSDWLSPFPLTLRHFISSHLDYLFFFFFKHIPCVLVVCCRHEQMPEEKGHRVEVFIELMFGGDTFHMAGKTR